MPQPILPPEEALVPIESVILSGDKEVWGYGPSIQYGKDGPLRQPKEGSDVPKLIEFRFEPWETLKRVTVDTYPLFYAGNIVLFTNTQQVFLCGNSFNHITGKYQLFGEVTLPKSAGNISDYAISNGDQLASDTNGSLWFCRPSPGMANNNAKCETFKKVELAENIQKISFCDEIGLALDSNGKVFSFIADGEVDQGRRSGRVLPRSPYAQDNAELSPDHQYAPVSGIPDDIWIVDMGVGRTCSYFLDNTGEMWVAGLTYDPKYAPTEDMLRLLEPYMIKTTGSVQKWPLHGSIMRDNDGRLHAEAIYIGSELCFLRKDNGDWWSWDPYRDQFEGLEEPKKQDQFFGCKLLLLNSGHALFALPPEEDTGNSKVVSFGVRRALGRPDKETGEEESPDAKIVGGLTYEPPQKRSRTKNAMKRVPIITDTDYPQSKRNRFFSISCSICESDRATCSSGGRQQAQYCSSYCASFHLRQLSHSKECPRNHRKGTETNRQTKQKKNAIL